MLGYAQIADRLPRQRTIVISLVIGVTTYLVPPLTIVMGLVFLGEAPPTLAYLGGILALVGVGVARRRPKEAGS